MARTPDAADVLRHDREAANAFSMRAGQPALRAALERAQASLERRLATAEGLRGPGPESFTATQARVTLDQVRQVLGPVTTAIRGQVLTNGAQAAEAGTKSTIDYMRAADRQFAGVGSSRLPLDEAAMHERGIQGTKASLLGRIESNPAHRGYLGVLDRYGGGVVQFFERDLQQRLLAREPWDDVRAALVKSSAFLQQAPAYWAERILRTEAMYASNRASYEAIVSADATLGDMCKVLICGIDARTGCLLGSASVTTGVVRAVFRRRYQGRVVRLVTESGGDFTATPNHPMLTRRGWIAAGELRLGDELIRDTRQQHAGTSRDQHVANRPTTIGEVFDTLAVLGDCERRRGSQKDFHGDGMDRDVDVLRPDNELRLGDFSPITQPLAHAVFAPTNDVQFCAQCGGLLSADAGAQAQRFCTAANVVTCLSNSAVDAALRNTEISADAFQRFAAGVALKDLVVGQRQATSGRVRAAVQEHGFAAGAAFDAVCGEKFEDVTAVGVHRCRDLVAGQAGRVQADRLTRIEVSLFDGHVFNLSTEDGYFVADGLYTGNSDSIAVHGQIRRPAGAFDSWNGSFQHPPDRPNDRATVTPHRIAWPIPEGLKPLPDAAIANRWALEKRKGPMPPRPLMTTIDLELFGKRAKPAPARQAAATAQAAEQQRAAAAAQPAQAQAQMATPRQTYEVREVHPNGDVVVRRTSRTAAAANRYAAEYAKKYMRVLEGISVVVVAVDA